MAYVIIQTEHIKQAITWLKSMPETLGKQVSQVPLIMALQKNLDAPFPDPVAWRTFDGEGGYEFRNYEDNQFYDEWWQRHNPNHLNWVDPLYTIPPLALIIDRYVWEEYGSWGGTGLEWRERESKNDPRLPENKTHNPNTNWDDSLQIRNFRALYTVPPTTPIQEQVSPQSIRDTQEAPFEAWWEREGQFGRAGGGQYEKTFAWNAWCAAIMTTQK